LKRERERARMGRHCTGIDVILTRRKMAASLKYRAFQGEGEGNLREEEG